MVAGCKQILANIDSILRCIQPRKSEEVNEIFFLISDIIIHYIATPLHDLSISKVLFACSSLQKMNFWLVFSVKEFYVNPWFSSVQGRIGIV